MLLLAAALSAGASYTVHYPRGLTTLSVDFELTDLPITYYKDRIISVTVSSMRRVGSRHCASR